MPKPRMPQTPAEFQAWADLYPPQPGSKTGPIDKKELYNREVDFFDWEQEQGDAMIAGLERRGIAAKPGDPDYEAANEAFLARVDAEHARRFNPAERKALEEMSRERSWGLIGDGSEDTADWMETLPDGAMTMHPGTKSQRINAMNEDAAAAAAKAAKAPAPVPTPQRNQRPHRQSSGRRWPLLSWPGQSLPTSRSRQSMSRQTHGSCP